MDGKYIRFDFFQRSKSGLTGVWHVVNKENGTPLGTVGWYGPWRKYCFFPNAELDLVFEEHCLRDIAAFCVDQTKQHKQQRRQPF